MKRRDFIKTAAGGAVFSALACTQEGKAMEPVKTPKPNLVFVFGDQWRYQTAGFAGNTDVDTPNIDKLANNSINFKYAISNQPVCSPFRASLITGRFPLTHGVFLNDLRLNTEAVSIADAYNNAGYETAYIGKWHIDGTGRGAYIPPERRQGFKYWKVLECTHSYFKSPYYEGDSDEKKHWQGYDAYAQTEDALNYIGERGRDKKPFSLFLSWGPPHNPYRQAPEDLVKKYSARKLTQRRNVPDGQADKAQQDLAGYYAHCEAMDQCIGRLVAKLEETGLDRNTLFVFTSDHGDMLYSQGQQRKQRPWDESIRIPFLLRCPSSWNIKPTVIEEPFGAPDMMPTILSLSGIDVPDTVEGLDCSDLVLGKRSSRDRAQLIMCPSPFGEYTRNGGGKEYRGVRTVRYTYVRDLNGAWLLYDNETDPCQQQNLANQPEHSELQAKLEKELIRLLEQTGDDFPAGEELTRRCGYKVYKTGTVGCDPESGHLGQLSVCATKSRT